MVAADVSKKIECNNCGIKFTLTFFRDEVEDKPEYCPFCGDLTEDVYKDFENEWDEEDGW